MINELNYEQYSEFLDKAEIMLSDFWDSEWVRKKTKMNLNSKLFAMYDDYIEKKVKKDKEVKHEYSKVKKFLGKMEESVDILVIVRDIKDIIIEIEEGVTGAIDEAKKKKLKEDSEKLKNYFKPGAAEKLRTMTENCEGRQPEGDEEFNKEYEALLALGSILAVLSEDYFAADEIKPMYEKYVKDLNDYVMFREIERFNFNIEMDRDELNHNIAKFLYTSKLKAELMMANPLTQEKITESYEKWLNIENAAEEMLKDPKLKEFIEGFGKKSSNKQILKALKDFMKGDGNGGGHGVRLQQQDRQPEQRQPEQRQPERNRIIGH